MKELKKELDKLKYHQRADAGRAERHRKRRPTSCGLAALFRQGREVYCRRAGRAGACPGQPANRLSLAQWLVSRDNPLTARVAINRYGTIFRSRAGRDQRGFRHSGRRHRIRSCWTGWLSSSWISGWRHEDHAPPDRDFGNVPANHRGDAGVDEARSRRTGCLARGPRFRLEAEMVRDAALREWPAEPENRRPERISTATAGHLGYPV